MRNTILTFAALCAPMLLHAQDGAARQISLPEAVDLAKKNAPSMIQARGALRTGQAAITAARWAFLPSLSLSYGSSRNGGGTYVNDVLVAQSSNGWGFNRGIGSLNLTLWDGGTKMGAVSRGRANFAAAEAGEINSEFNVTQQVKAQYYTILQARETEANARATLEQAQFQSNLAKARLNAGTATTSDTLSAFVALTNAQLTILNARNQQNNANAQLTRLTAAPYLVTAIAADSADPAPLAINDAELFMLAEQGPTVRQSEAQLKAAQVTEKTSRASYWPQVSTSFGFSQNNRDTKYDFGAGRMNYSWNFGISASYTVWNAYNRESSVINARVAADNAEASLRESKLVARQNLTQQLGLLRVAEETMRYQRLNIAAGEENLRVVTKRYELGSGLLLDVITAQNTLNSSRASLTQARVNARNARAQIELIIGRDLGQ